MIHILKKNFIIRLTFKYFYPRIPSSHEKHSYRDKDSVLSGIPPPGPPMVFSLHKENPSINLTNSRHHRDEKPEIVATPVASLRSKSNHKSRGDTNANDAEEVRNFRRSFFYVTLFTNNQINMLVKFILILVC